MNMEPQCTPSRSSILTGRFAVRSGTYAVPFGGVPDGLTQWEVTIGEALSVVGYATALYGKWHLGSHDGRLPNDQGFDDWKLHFYRQDTMADPPVKLPVPALYNLYTDPREEKPTVDTWVVYPMLKIVGAFEGSLQKCPLIPMGTPDPYEPPPPTCP